MIRRIALFFSFFTLLLVLTFPLKALADTNGSSQNVVLQRNEVINKDYFAAGETVTISGTVNGDAYVAGGNVIIEGEINGDLLAAGGTVNIRGKVRDDVRVAGGQIVVSGEIGRNITTVGGSVTIADSAKINGSLTAGTGSLSVFAPIGKEANFGAGQVTIGNIINGDVQAGVGQLTLTPLSQITGNLTYWSDLKAQIDPGAKVIGKITHNIPPKPPVKQKDVSTNAGALFGAGIAFTLISYLSALIIGLLLIKFLPVYTQQTASIVLKSPLQSLGIGFLSILFAPFIFILLLLIILCILFVFFLLFLFFK